MQAHVFFRDTWHHPYISSCFCGKRFYSHIYIYDKNGEVLSEEAEIIGRWKEHFEDGPYQNTPWREVPLEDDLEIMKEEVR